jgi:aspartate/methionine/tyrosine aminotransferase
MRTGAPMLRFALFNDQGGFNLDGLSEQLSALTGPATLLLNFPQNPTGYAPTRAEAAAIVARIAAHPLPLAVLCDDAYQGMYWADDCFPGSLFGKLVEVADPARLVVCKVDGATKELVFFGGRVGFLTFGLAGRAGEILAEKATAILRGTISSAPASSQAIVLAALGDPHLAAQQEEVLGTLARRYWALRTALDASGVPYWPFNAGCFALVRLRDDQSAHRLRQRLIREQSTGVIEATGANALRVAFCSVDEADIPDLVARIAQVVLA